MSDTQPAIDPYQYFQHLRQNAPVSRMEDGGPWQVTKHADVNAILRDHTTFSSDVSVRTIEERGAPSMLFSDPPMHHRLRKLVSRAFKPSHIESQRGLIQAKCDMLVSKMSEETQVDLVKALAAPLPVTVIAYMLGVEDGDMDTFKYWSDAIFSNIADILFAEPSPEAAKASEEMNAYFIERIEALRLNPADHLLGRLVETETDEGMLTNEELLSFCALLLIAGNETTTGLITASVRVFDKYPETFQQVKQDPSLIPTFVEEALRFYSPFSGTVRRTSCDTEISGVKIAKGELVIPMIASANRDESVFDNAESFVIDRNPNPHLAFGFGIHFCLGAHLARLEGEIAVAALTQAFNGISLVDTQIGEESLLGGPTELLVNLVK
ncbi:MAG: cytochrome P450 [Pseudomonadales bacterium]|nr:cytochrome P450 [Pseudomonadales bacterium]MDG1441572.1 cytochrome P450 [Pseudomonadales bacterium]